MAMEANWLSTAMLDPSWIAVMGAIGAVGLIATVVVLVRQATPRARVDWERISRRRETGARAAH